MASQITGVPIVCSTVCSGADQRKHQSSASLAPVMAIHWSRWNPLTKGQYSGKRVHLMTSFYQVTVLCMTRSLELVLTINGANPAGTRRNNNVFTTTTRRRRRRVDVVKTLPLRLYCVMCLLGSQHRQHDAQKIKIFYPEDSLATSSNNIFKSLNCVWNYLSISKL